mmetsp:Transcript_5288/g.15052  ORF Transcript_5288/g.15052 Transcript_5288/m.15052 type:complete len:539 (-) Transcript_5288:349-1965(-)
MAVFMPVESAPAVSPFLRERTNQTMVDGLVQSGSLRSPECVAAFQAVDRQHFWPDGWSDVYSDMPLRRGRLHLSAPHMYARVLESLLPLGPGVSFLNVGSGTGYFNAVVSALTGDMAVNHGVDIWTSTMEHAEACLWRLGKTSIELTLGNIYELDVNKTARYERVYLGACANSRSKYLYQLLEVGGVLVGPFQSGHLQQLRRVVRQSETQFSVEVLGSVQFTSLMEPTSSGTVAPSRVGGHSVSFGWRASHRHRAPFPRSPSSSPALSPARLASPRSSVTSDNNPSGLPGVPFTFTMPERPWCLERSWTYPTSFRRAVEMVLSGRPREEHRPHLPVEIWTKHVFPLTSRGWFDVAPPVTPQMMPLPSPMIQPSDPEDCNPRKVPRTDPGDDFCLDAASTAAPSTANSSSLNTTPDSHASDPPELFAPFQDARTVGSPSFGGGVLFEVYENGSTHAIGAQDDPDDQDPDDGPGLMVPLHVLQLLALNTMRPEPESEEEVEGGADDEEGPSDMEWPDMADEEIDVDTDVEQDLELNQQWL